MQHQPRVVCAVPRAGNGIPLANSRLDNVVTIFLTYLEIFDAKCLFGTLRTSSLISIPILIQEEAAKS
ncbi:hypothetical protein AOQ72_10710 [Bradyrhizobium yuanmingense]|uniref:Uncharacterized protein n=1 Tax=Bradyrhizobium yuanmingense TaxID=108015 RepID=A0A0R3CZK8_9BRAD|nr:hypothetical protein AOQ72_10710 [Bradyrhizobium yuanmingense]